MVFFVSNLNDSGNGSLRWAVDQANASQGFDDIRFDTSLSGGTLLLRTALPDIVDSVSIQGIVGERGEPRVAIDFGKNRGVVLRRNAKQSTISDLALVNSKGAPLLRRASSVKLTNVLVYQRLDKLTGISSITGSASSSTPVSNFPSSFDYLTGEQISVDNESTIGCTRVLWNDNPLAVLVGRSGDWFKANDPRGASSPKIQVMPRGLRKSGAMFGNTTVVKVNPAKWTSRYGSVVVSNEDTVVFEGTNEKGLAAHCLSLPVTEYGDRDVTRQGLQMGLWVPYILDNASTVKEAIALLPKLQPVPVVLDNFGMKVSLSIEDPSGDSAIVEYLNGALKIRHGREYTMMSNSEIDESLETLKSYDFKDATRDFPLPGNANPLQRFIRGSFFRYYLGKMTPRNITEARAALMSVIRNVSNPIGAPGTRVGLNDETDWRVLTDLTNRMMIYDNPRNLNVLYTDLTRINFRRGTGVRTINPQDPRFNGDVTRLYRRTRDPVPGLIGPR